MLKRNKYTVQLILQSALKALSAEKKEMSFTERATVPTAWISVRKATLQRVKNGRVISLCHSWTHKSQLQAVQSLQADSKPSYFYGFAHLVIKDIGIIFLEKNKEY